MTTRDPAAARFAAIQLVRLSGVALVLVGLLVSARRIALLDFLPPWVGYVFVTVGMVEVFYLPLLLARRWKSPPE